MNQAASSILAKSNSKISLDTSVMNIGIVWYDMGKHVKQLNSKNTKIHHHNFYELHIVLSGSATMMAKDTNISLTPGNFILFPPKSQHSNSTMSSDYREFALGFYLDFPLQHPDSEWLKQTFSSLSAYELQACSQAIDACCQNVIHAMKAEPCLTSAVALHALLLIQQIANELNPKRAGIPSPVTKENTLIAQAKSYISANLTEGIHSTDVAHYLNMDLRYLNRVLEKNGEPTVNALIMNEKMKKICHLLESTDMPLDQIAYVTGFSNEYNMSRAFKKSQGFSPGAYRYACRDK